jgi:branched-chain amino acid aminotransferase group I
VKTSSFTHHHPNITMCNAKAVCNYAVSILANQEATHDGYEEAMLMDPQGYVCQGSGENVFIVRDGKLHTPDLSGGALNGITRDTIITFANELGIPVVERRITRDEVYIADEAFFTGTAAEVTPIREYDHRPIGDGRRGPITTKLAGALLRHRQRPQSFEEGVADEGLTMAETREQVPIDGTPSDLPVFCPNPQMPLWSSHPRVFLDVADEGESLCPYCGTRYRLVGGR